MTVKAKTILENKFWIVEDEGVKIGTLSKNDEGFVVTAKGKIEIFKSENQLKKKFGVDIEWSIVGDSAEKSLPKDFTVHGYPTSVAAYNSMYDVKRKLPLFTKSEKSKSLYCAGYYIIRFEKGWVKSFCPKLITIERYENRGPFKSELERRQELSRVNN